MEVTNHVATSLHSLVSNLPFLQFYVSSLSFLVPLIISPRLSLHLITFSPSSHTVLPKAGRVPIGAAATQHNLNDLIVIHSISLQQRNLSVLDRNQYGHE